MNLVIRILIILTLINGNKVYSLNSVFNITYETKCPPARITFSNQSETGPGINFIWDFDKGVQISSNDIVQQQVYSSTGTFTITLFAIEGTDTVKSSQNIFISQGPSAGFSYDKSSGCRPLKINYTNTSTPGSSAIIDVTWDLRSGVLYKNPDTVSYVYNTPGSYDALITVTDNNDCSDYFELQDIIEVYDLPSPLFTVSDSFSCVSPFYVNFINNTTNSNITEYLWDFGNGTISYSRDTSIVYNAKGNYDVSLKLTDANGCSEITVKNEYIGVGLDSFQIFAVQEPDIYTDTICRGPVSFGTFSEQNISYTWTALYNQNTIISSDKMLNFEDLDADSIIIKLVYAENTPCKDSIIKTFYIDSFNPDIYTDTTTFCKFPVNITLKTDTINVHDIIWTLPDNSTNMNPEITYEINETENYKRIYSHKINKYIYPFYLEITNNRGCRIEKIKNINVNTPIARFVPQQISGCIPFEINIKDESKSVEDIISRKYIIGNDTVYRDDTTMFSYWFNTSGNYDIKMIIENESQCVDTSFAITISAGSKTKPDIILSKNKVCATDSIQITATVDTLSFWHFNSQDIFNISADTNSVWVDIISTSIGSKDIYIETQYNGCISDTIIKNAFYVSGPTGVFTQQFDCVSPLEYTFKPIVSYATSYNWKVDNNVFNDQDSLTYTFPASGDYNVVMTAFNDTSGCSIEKRKTIKARQVNASFTTDAVSCGKDITVDASGSYDFLQICNKEAFIWNYGDSTKPYAISNSEFYHIYENPGDYQIKLTAIAENGCTDSAFKNIKVVYFVPDFTMDNDHGCAPSASIQFTRTSNIANLSSITWYFGDGDSIKNLNNVSHIYTSNRTRTFYAGLKEVDTYGCYNITYKPIFMYKPEVYFTANKIRPCLNDVVTFYLNNPMVSDFSFDFGDGTTAANSSYHAYENPGNYDISLTYTLQGCTNNYTRNNYIIIDQIDTSINVNNSNFDCYPAEVEFNFDDSGVSIIDGIWNFGDNDNKAPYSSSATYTYTRPGEYNTSLWFKTYNNCEYYGSKIINVSGQYAEISTDRNVACLGTPVIFSMTGLQNTTDYEWYFEDGQTSVESDPVHLYNSEGTYNPKLLLRSDICEDVEIKNVSPIVISSYNASFSINSANTEYCLYDSVKITNTSETPNGIRWYMDDIQFSSSVNPPSIYLTDYGMHIVKVIADNLFNCSDTAEISFTVDENPDFQIMGDDLICKGNTGAMWVNQEEGWSVFWQPDKGLTDNGAFSHSISPDTSITYFATVFNANGCRSIQSFHIDVPSLLYYTKEPVRDTTIDLNKSIFLKINTDNENVTYNWKPDYFLSCIHCSSPMASPKQNTTYKAIISTVCETDTALFNINVYGEYYLEAPTAFTPNGDGNNDIFKLETFNISEITEFKIFNRWGNLVFSTDNIDEGWDGTINGKIQNMDTYAYFVKAKTVFDTEVEKRGSLILIK